MNVREIDILILSYAGDDLNVPTGPTVAAYFPANGVLRYLRAASS